MYYYVYKTTNLINGKFYIGAHQTSDLSDGYLGSGTYLNRAIKKYGRENFSKEILSFFENEKQMFEFETHLVEQHLSHSSCYNLASGGLGGSIRQNRKPFTKKHTQESKQAISVKNRGRRLSTEAKEKIKARCWAKTDPENQRVHARKAALISHQNRKDSGYTLQESSREKISQSLKHYFETNGSSCKGKPKNKIECPYCKKQVAINTAKRWHFENCKSMGHVV